ncbi:hypothetical protein H4S07_003173 [Coemansia furcata]|uniref:Uncharacterized protein n=1 Tax=Coemansia furcata TaxID=417177 RepID=A0ACC1LIL2_9FUNG|nr:hypothetical protein H4S07_003173 [Coemansia furcata]
MPDQSDTPVASLVERQSLGQHTEDLIPKRHGVADALVMLLPPEEDHDLAMARIFSDPVAMGNLEFKMLPNGYSAEVAAARRLFLDERQEKKERLNYTVVVKKSLVPEHVVDKIDDDEYLPPKRVYIDDGHIDVDEPYIVVGCCGLLNIDAFNRSASAGIIVDARFWRTGISSAALYYSIKFGFNDLKLHRIGIETTEKNAGMRGWTENVLGVHVEGIKKEALYLGNGKFVDSWEYVIFDYQWHGRAEAHLRSKLRMVG